VKLIFEKLSRQFDREAFYCGVDSLNEFLKRYALQNLKKNLGVTIVAAGEANRSKILGYYTVSMAQVSFKELPEELAGGIPRYPVPAMRIGRLAVDKSAQGMGLGGELLRDALFRALDLSLEVGTCVVLVDAIDAQAKRFYEKYGFVPLIDMPLSLVLPVKTIAEAWKSKE
jgi:ribosomal protein S18 acetylase RimI-like enzyme